MLNLREIVIKPPDHVMTGYMTIKNCSVWDKGIVYFCGGFSREAKLDYASKLTNEEGVQWTLSESGDYVFKTTERSS